MKRKKLGKISKAKVFGIFFGLLLLGALGWFLVRFALTEAELKVISKYDFPATESAKGMWQLNNSDYAVAIDGKVVDGQSFGAGEIETRPTASTAKMILGLAVMKKKPFSEGEFGETITITDEMYETYLWYQANGGSNTKVIPGEEISEYDALVSVFLASSNNMADSLAVWAFGSLDAYREYASSMLEEWGLENTKIGKDASGFSDTTTSTAPELAQIGAKVMSEPVLKKIVSTKSYEVPVAGLLSNTNLVLGQLGIAGVKTGYIGDVSGYCLVSGYMQGEHIVTVSVLGAQSRQESFDASLAIVAAAQEAVKPVQLVSEGDVIGYYDSWWTGPIAIKAQEDFSEVLWAEAERESDITMLDQTGTLDLAVEGNTYKIAVQADDYVPTPSFWERVMHIFGWEKDTNEGVDSYNSDQNESADKNSDKTEEEEVQEAQEEFKVVTNVPSDNCTIKYGYLMLINPNFTVTTDFIDARKSELVSVSSLYGIREGNPYNGDNLLDAEAAEHLNEMVRAYEAEYPGHTFETRSCYRARGTTCGRMCAATGTSDHHTGLTCDLLDPAYGTELGTDAYDQHIDWQWLYANSYKYGFIDRFPYDWAGGPMSEPANVDENGSTGLFETWHYRYVGVGPATEIATGKYNNGNYDSLEHYLKMRGLVSDLKNGRCE